MSYPIPFNYQITSKPSLSSSQISQMEKNLKIDKRKPSPVIISDTPIKFDRTPIEHPLNDLILKSKEFLENFNINSHLDLQQHEFNELKSPQKPIASRTRGTKRKNDCHEDYENEENDANTSYFQANSSSVLNTPVRNKTIFFSPAPEINKNQFNTPIASTHASSKPNSSTPGPLREIQLNHKRSLIDVTKGRLNIDKALVKPAIEYSRDKENNQDDDIDEDSDSDHLACHAHNILRMAVDSTMLGSTFNSSFSSVNDSILGKNSNILDEDLDKSLIEIVKSRKNNILQKKLATKIEISADDLKNVLS